MNEETTALIAPDNERIMKALVSPDAMLELMKPVRDAIDAFEPDISTAAGRKAIGSLAYNVARAKTTIDAVGKDAVSLAKAKIKKVDNVRRLARDTLDTWKDEARKPLTDWEALNEAAKAQIVRLESLGSYNWQTVEDMRNALKEIEGINVADYPEDFMSPILFTRDNAIESLTVMIAAAEKVEADRVELERLQKAEADRKAADELERIKRVAAETARKQAEEKAQADIKEAERKAGDAERRAEDAEKRAKVQAEYAKEAEERREKAAEEARDMLRKGSDEKLVALKDAKKRAYLDLVECGMTPDEATVAVMLVAAGKIRHMEIVL